MSSKPDNPDDLDPNETYVSPTWCAKHFADLEDSFRRDSGNWLQAIDVFITHWPGKPPDELLRIRDLIKNDPTAVAKKFADNLDRIVGDAYEKQVFRRDVAQLREFYAGAENCDSPLQTMHFYCIVGISPTSPVAVKNWRWGIFLRAVLAVSRWLTVGIL